MSTVITATRGIITNVEVIDLKITKEFTSLRWSAGKKHPSVELLNGATTARVTTLNTGVKAVLGNNAYLLGTDKEVWIYRVHQGSTIQVGMAEETRDLTSLVANNDSVAIELDVVTDSQIRFFLYTDRLEIEYDRKRTTVDITAFAGKTMHPWLTALPETAGFSVSINKLRYMNLFFDEDDNAVLSTTSEIGISTPLLIDTGGSGIDLGGAPIALENITSLPGNSLFIHVGTTDQGIKILDPDGDLCVDTKILVNKVQPKTATSLVLNGSGGDNIVIDDSNNLIIEGTGCLITTCVNAPTGGTLDITNDSNIGMHIDSSGNVSFDFTPQHDIVQSAVLTDLQLITGTSGVGLTVLSADGTVCVTGPELQASVVNSKDTVTDIEFRHQGTSKKIKFKPTGALEIEGDVTTSSIESFAGTDLTLTSGSSASGLVVVSASGDVRVNENLLIDNGYMQFTDVTAPTNPSAGEGRLYKKVGDDGLFWKPDSLGPEVDLTAGISEYDTNPQTIASTLEAVDFKTTTYPSYDAAITGITQGSEFPKLASVPTPAAGTLRFYANTDDTFHQKDDSGVDKIIGNEGQVLGPNSVTADGKVAIYNGTTGKALKDSNLLVDAQNRLNISGNFARYQNFDYLIPNGINDLAAVGYVNQERDASNTRITTLETKTARIGVLPGNITFVETTDFLPNGEGIEFGSIIPPTVPTIHNINRIGNPFFNVSEEIFKRNLNLVSNSPAATNNVFTEKITAAANIGGSSTGKDVDYEILTGSGTTVTTRLKIGADNITTLTADTININTSTGNKFSVGEFKTIIREQLDIVRQNTPVMKIIHEGSTSISDTAGYILCEGGVGAGGVSWFLGTFGGGSNLLKLESKAPNTNIELITADVNRVRLKADGTFEILDGNLVLSEQLEQRTNGVALQDFDNIKSGGVLDSEQVSKRKIGAYDNTNTIAPLVNEIVTAVGNITATNHASDYEIKTSRSGSVVKDTRLKIGANGDTDIAGQFINLVGNTRVPVSSTFELSSGSVDSYIFPQNRPQAGDVLTGGTGNGLLAWQKTGYSRANTNDITTSSPTYVTMTDMTLTPGAGKYLVLFSGNFTHDGGKNDAYVDFSIFNNGSEVAHSHRYAWLETDPVYTPLSTQAFVTLADGETVDVRWRDVEGEDPRCVEKSLLLVRVS